MFQALQMAPPAVTKQPILRKLLPGCQLVEQSCIASSALGSQVYCHLKLFSWRVLIVPANPYLKSISTEKSIKELARLDWKIFLLGKDRAFQGSCHSLYVQGSKKKMWGHCGHLQMRLVPVFSLVLSQLGSFSLSKHSPQCRLQKEKN